MAEAAYRFCTANAAIVLASSSQDWANQGNIYASEGNDANVAADLEDGQWTNYLVAKGFGFTLPNDAIVTGIQVEIEQEGEHIKDKHVYLTLNGTSVTGNDKKKTAKWTNADLKMVYGSTSDEWGLRLTGADVNKICFGVAIAAEDVTTPDIPTIDGIRMQLTYTDPSDSTTTSSDLKKGRDIYRLLDKFMANKCTTKQFTILHRNDIYEITEWSF